MAIHELFTYLRVSNAAEAIAFYERAFGARERFRLTEPNGRIGHAELDFGAGVVMLSDAFPEYGLAAPPPQTAARAYVSIHLHVDDADAVIAQAVAAGATLVRPPQDQFYGERSGAVRDPFGHEWLVGHSLEQLSPEEMQRRYTKLFESP